MIKLSHFLKCLLLYFGILLFDIFQWMKLIDYLVTNKLKKKKNYVVSYILLKYGTSM